MSLGGFDYKKTFYGIFCAAWVAANLFKDKGFKLSYWISHERVLHFFSGPINSFPFLLKWKQLLISMFLEGFQLVLQIVLSS